MEHKKSGNLLVLILLFALFTVLWTGKLSELGQSNYYRQMTLSSGTYREKFGSKEQKAVKEQLSEECRAFLENVENEVIYYPVPESTVDKELKTSFVDTWQAERSYDGKRGHEGTDIMASRNERGVYPVVSMTDGVVTNLGWLEKGGYRIGITTDSSTYYYYAHLESYADTLWKGKSIKAGELLGYMGDSGYGPEGTVGKFAVHLHVGIYCYADGEEISVNPYYVLRSLENKKLKYAYS